MTTIHFYLRFHSSFGQNFFVTGNIPGLGNGDVANTIPMQYLNDEYWIGIVQVPRDTAEISYNYILQDVDGAKTIESRTDRTIHPAELKLPELQVIDTWNYTGEYENAFYTQPFTETLLKHNTAVTATAKKPKHFTHIFRVKAPLLTGSQTLCLTGSCDEMGKWNAEQPVIMHLENKWYTAYLDLENTQLPVAYKYGVWDTASNSFIQFESGHNRTLHGTGKKQTTILHDGFAGLPNNTFKGAGVAIPVFSLRSENSYGVGEFADIKLLVDWAKQIGLKLIQLLPVNDTTAVHSWLDSYPYSAISAFALHPMYINIEKMAGEKHSEVIASMIANKTVLNSPADMDYDGMIQGKWAMMKALFAAMKKSWKSDSGYKKFYEANKHWLLPYAVFCYLRDKNHTSDFSKWTSHNTYSAKEAEALIAPNSKMFDDVAIHLFIQYHLHLQLEEAVDYAHKNGVIMKGDIPIGIYRYSCDAWMQPELYNMDEQAGAPPDDFAITGQNWGFPTYKWKKMQKDGYSWWKQRFEQMSHYFDAFRIDHILGFFRIWSIPTHAINGIMGRFVPCIPIYPAEFNEKGIWFDHDRYCRPFINNEILYELFGNETSGVKDQFLYEKEWNTYALKPQFDTQLKVEEWFRQHDDSASSLKQKLFDLISNVILFDDTTNPDASIAGYHFRIEMENTSSFKYLEPHLQWQLKELYVNYFFRRQDAYWKKEAMHKLPALKSSTNMLICGEDLGMVPQCVPGVMKDLGLLSLEIQRMPKDPTQKFFHPSQAPYLSVVTPSTHDMSTIRGWWEEDRNDTQQFFNTELGYDGEAPKFCEPWINREIVKQHMKSTAMWSIFQLQDLMGSDGTLRRENPHDERINIPANPKHYWRYRIHITLEQLLLETDFNEDLKQLLQESSRA